MRVARVALSLLGVALLGVATLTATPATSQDDYVKQIDEWHAKRIERLRRPTGWMTLVGLFRLPEGDHSFGSAPDNDLVFPPKAPPRAGIFHTIEGRVSLDVEPGVVITVDDAPVTSLPLQSDVEENTTVMTMGSLQFLVIERGGQALLRVRDLEHPSLQTFAGIERYPVSPAWRKVARFERYDPPRTIEIGDVLGNVNKEACPGALVFEHEGKEYRLLPTLEDDELFIVFADATSGDETYGGGRFLYADLPAEGDEVVVDFNKSYNPPCVFTPFATCALPPKENTLGMAIRAGEKNYHGYEH